MFFKEEPVMNKVSSMRITIPNKEKSELYRNNLIQTITNNQIKFAYIHAGAGYGKTTLLAQLAHSNSNTIWLTLAGESDVFTFVNALCEAVKKIFPDFDFAPLEFFRLSDQDNFIYMITDAFLNSLEKLDSNLLIILDDFHTINDQRIKELTACLMKYFPDNFKLCLASREALWPELLPFYMRGLILVIGQAELAFTREEVAALLSFDDTSVYELTEGWPLAIISFKILLDQGISLKDIPSKSKESLYSYLSYECISRLPDSVVEFLKLTSCFEELDSEMLDSVLDRNNSGSLLEELVEKNYFIIKNSSGIYRYHALFKKYLLDTVSFPNQIMLQEKAAEYYINKKEYHRAAEYALLIDNKDLLQNILLSSYKIFMRCGNYSELKLWFDAIGDNIPKENAELLVAKGAFLSIIGKFTKANVCLDTAIPRINEDNSELYIEAMLHKARVYRNCISFEESNQLLDKLAALVHNPASEIGYDINIERLYNYCWNSQINEAYSLVYESMEICSRTGSLKIRAWYERYLSAVHFFAGRMKDSVYYYEKSLELSEDEQLYLDMHGIGIYAAKAYQMIGNNELALSLLSKELQKLKNTGKYEEMWSGYLFAAEIHYQNSFIDKRNGKDVSFETTKKFFLLADEYAPLYRKTDFQMQWARMQRLTYSLIFTNESKAKIISELNLNEVGDYLKCIILARLMGYFAVIYDYANAIKCAKYCIKIGEQSNMLLHSTLAYGILARAALASQDEKASAEYIEKYLKLCSELGLYEYFRMRSDYDPILKYASEHCIEPKITSEIMNFVGYKRKKVYIKTFGSLTIFPYDNRNMPIKMRTKKERELFAFLLNAGDQGATKEQIYQAIWSESESKNIKKLIGVNLSQLKKDLDCFGIENVILCHEKLYKINQEEMECDNDLYETAAERFELTAEKKEANILLSLYSGEYLSDFEAFWATGKRLKYHTIYENAINSVSSNNNIGQGIKFN